MYENDNNYDVEVEDVMEDMDGMGHPIATIIVSLLGGAALGTGGTLLVKKLMNNDNKKLERKQKKLKKLKKDAEKLGIDLSDIPEVSIPEDEELDGEIETDEEDGQDYPEIRIDKGEVIIKPDRWGIAVYSKRSYKHAEKVAIEHYQKATQIALELSQ